jgi:hypothetical protein
MNPWLWVDPQVQQVRIADVQAYLSGRGWTLQPSANPNLLRFQGPDDGHGPPPFQMVPASEQLADFRQRITELITTLSEMEGRHPVAVLHDILRSAQAGTAGNGAEQASGAQGARNR